MSRNCLNFRMFLRFWLKANMGAQTSFDLKIMRTCTCIYTRCTNVFPDISFINPGTKTWRPMEQKCIALWADVCFFPECVFKWRKERIWSLDLYSKRKVDPRHVRENLGNHYFPLIKQDSFKHLNLRTLLTKPNSEFIKRQFLPETFFRHDKVTRSCILRKRWEHPMLSLSPVGVRDFWFKSNWSNAVLSTFNGLEASLLLYPFGVVWSLGMLPAVHQLWKELSPTTAKLASFTTLAALCVWLLVLGRALSCLCGLGDVSDDLSQALSFFEKHIQTKSRSCGVSFLRQSYVCLPQLFPVQLECWDFELFLFPHKIFQWLILAKHKCFSQE